MLCYSMLNILYLYVSVFRNMCAVSNMAVSCSSLISCFPGVLFWYFLILITIIIIVLCFVVFFYELVPAV
jgi:hypothetical protein